MIQRVRLTIPPLAITVAIFFGFLFLAWFVSQTVWVWVVALIALILAAAMSPLVNLVQRLAFPPHGWHIPRGLAVFLVYLLVFVTLGLGGVIVGNLLVDEIASILGGSTLSALAAEFAAPGRLAEALHISPALVPSSTQVAASLRQIGTSLLTGIARHDSELCHVHRSLLHRSDTGSLPGHQLRSRTRLLGQPVSGSSPEPGP